MLLFLYGADTFRSRQQLRKMIDKFKKDRDPRGYNVARLDCTKETPDKIMSEILAVPFLAEKRMVVLEQFLTSKSIDCIGDVLQRIENNTIPETNNILFFEDGEEKSVKTKQGKALFARLKKEKYAQESSILTGTDLFEWIVAEITERGGQIDRSAVHFLAQHIGDMWRLNSVLDQLIAYKQHEVIQERDVVLFVDEKADDNIFSLVDAIVGKQPTQVYAMIAQQYREGKDADYIFAMIVRQIRILLELRDVYDRDEQVRSDVLAKTLGLHPFVVKKSLSLVKRYTLNSLKQLHQELLDMDRQTKTGHADRSLLLDVFVGRLISSES